MTKLKVLDLFSGIGGFSLGLERTGGFETVAFCEIDPFCRKVLAKHWPNVRQYEDVRELTAERLAADGIVPEVLCGGFPCQDISFAGKGAGIEGERSGLWSEYARLIGELRPEYVIVENVAALLSRGLDKVLGDLASIGFDAEWHCIPASAVGAPHRRDRLWLVAYARGEQHESRSIAFGWPGAPEFSEAHLANPDQPRLEGWLRRSLQECSSEWTARTSSPLANAAGERCGEAGQYSERHSEWTASGGQVLANPPCGRRDEWHSDTGGRSERTSASEEWHGPSISSWWLSEPELGRVAHGIPNRAHRLRGLGNAVVPQIPELIGHAILEARAA